MSIKIQKTHSLFFLVLGFLTVFKLFLVSIIPISCFIDVSFQSIQNSKDCVNNLFEYLFCNITPNIVFNPTAPYIQYFTQSCKAKPDNTLAFNFGFTSL